MQQVIQFIVGIMRKPSIFMGIIALLGLLLQKKSFNETVEGTVKTIIGVIILMKGVGIINSSITPISKIFKELFTIQGNAVANYVPWMKENMSTIGLVMVLSFIVNLIVARLTRIRNVFLTGHIFFWIAFMSVAVSMESAGLNGVPLIISGTIITSIYIIISPALVTPFVKELTGKEDPGFTIGHSTVGISIIGAYLGKWFGNPDTTTEDLEVPDQLQFLKEVTISTSVVMFLMYLLLWGILAVTKAPNFIANLLKLKQGYFLYALTKGLTFGAGMTVLLTGVRMMLDEIIPAFRGVAKKLIPGAIPALDCPMIFPYAPNAVTIGFVISLVTSIITIFIFGLAQYSWVLLPLVVACFFDVGPAAVLANATGGVRGAVIASAVGGVLLIVFQAISLPIIANTVGGFINVFGGNDFSLIAMIFGPLLQLFGL